MAIGQCQFLTCRSSVGSSFRALFYALEAGATRMEVLMCATHERECDELLKKHRLMISEEGVVYPALWMTALGYMA